MHGLRAFAQLLRQGETFEIPHSQVDRPGIGKIQVHTGCNIPAKNRFGDGGVILTNFIVGVGVIGNDDISVDTVNHQGDTGADMWANKTAPVTANLPPQE